MAKKIDSKKRDKKAQPNQTKKVILYVVLGLSLFANACFVFVPIILREQLIFATVNSGENLKCSDEFRQNFEKYRDRSDQKDYRQSLAFLDYSCGQYGAQKYYEKGYNEYLRSLNIPAKQLFP